MALSKRTPARQRHYGISACIGGGDREMAAWSPSLPPYSNSQARPVSIQASGAVVRGVRGTRNDTATPPGRATPPPRGCVADMCFSYVLPIPADVHSDGCRRCGAPFLAHMQPELRTSSSIPLELGCLVLHPGVAHVPC